MNERFLGTYVVARLVIKNCLQIVYENFAIKENRNFIILNLLVEVKVQ